MKIKRDVKDVWKEYTKAKDYNMNLDLYETVKQNQKFYNGDQWDGVNAPNIPKPVFNLLKRVVSYFVSILVSDDISVSFEPFNESDKELVMTCKIMSQEVENAMESNKFRDKARRAVKNCAVDGDTGMFFFLDMGKNSNQMYQGLIEAENTDNTNVMFGNPYLLDVQKQPFILIEQRMYVGQVKQMAEENGLSESEVMSIVPDNDYSRPNDDSDELVTVINKFWKENGTVHYMRCTKDVVIKEETDLGYTLYPIAYFTWEEVKNSYHGKSPLTAVIPNQIAINKLIALCMYYVQANGFPMITYDTTKISKMMRDITKDAGLPSLDLAGKIIDGIRLPDFSNQVIQMIELVIANTKELMGAGDASLGDISHPDNTSAIIAVQQATAMPLELQRQAYYEFIESCVRIMIDMMATDYGVRVCKYTDESGAAMPVAIDFSSMKDMNMKVNIDIGQSTYWSELTQVNTISNLFAQGVIPDPIVFLDSIPDKYVKNKQKIIDSIRQHQAQQAQMQQIQMSKQANEDQLAYIERLRNSLK